MRRFANCIVFGAALAALVACSDFRASQLMRTATALGAEGKWSEALHYYQRLWVQFPDNENVDEAKLRAARIYAGPEKKLRSALDLFQDLALSAKSDDVKVTALREMTELFRKQGGDRQRAIELMEIHLRRYPDRPDSAEVRLQLVELYLDAQLWQQALNVGEPLLKHADPKIVAKAYVASGNAKELAGQPAAGLFDYEAALASKEIEATTWTSASAGKARTLEMLGRRDEAIQVLEGLRERHPNPQAIERWLSAMQTRLTESNR